MKRLIAFVLITLLLAGCAKTPNALQGTKAPPVITLWHSFQGDELKALNQALEDLVKSAAGYKLEAVYVRPEDFAARVNQAQAAGKGPDLFLTGAEKIPDLMTTGVIQPLDNLFDTTPFFKAAVDAVSFNGSVYAVPRSVRVPMLVFNKNLSPAPPGNVAGLVDSAGKITLGKAVGLSGDLSDNFLVSPIFASYGGKLFGQDLRPAFDAPETLAFLQAVAALGGIKAGSYDPVFSQGLVGYGTTPFGLMGSNELGAYKGNVGYAALPGKALVQADGYVVSAHSAFVREAAAAAVYLSEKLPVAYPARPAAYQDKPPEAQLVKNIAGAGNGYPLDSRTKLLLPIFSQAVKDVLGGADPAAAAAAAQVKALKALGMNQP